LIFFSDIKERRMPAAMQVYIPTHMRENKQRCFKSLPEPIASRVFLAAHDGQAKRVASCNPKANVIDLGATDGIADVRQKILEYASADKVMMIDDQCKFKRRGDDGRLVEMTSNDFVDMFATVERLLDVYPMVGVSDRGGNFRVAEDVQEIGRSYSCYGINRNVWRRLGVRFDGLYQLDTSITILEDFYAILKLLTLGEKNAIIYNFAFESTHGFAGGCSNERSQDTQRKSIEALQSHFPGLVQIVQKQNPSWNVGNKRFRWECRVQWRKAHLQSSKSHAVLETTAAPDPCTTFDIHNKMLCFDSHRLMHKNEEWSGTRYVIVLYNKSINYVDSQNDTRSVLIAQAPENRAVYITRNAPNPADLLRALEVTNFRVVSEGSVDRRRVAKESSRDGLYQGRHKHAKYGGREARYLSFGISQSRRSRKTRAEEGLMTRESSNKNNTVHRQLYDTMLRYFQEIDPNLFGPDARFHACIIAKDMQCEWHKDVANIGPCAIMALGPFTGGRLLVRGDCV
jgi:hypothetical protein